MFHLVCRVLCNLFGLGKQIAGKHIDACAPGGLALESALADLAGRSGALQAAKALNSSLYPFSSKLTVMLACWGFFPESANLMVRNSDLRMQAMFRVHMCRVIRMLTRFGLACGTCRALICECRRLCAGTCQGTLCVRHSRLQLERVAGYKRTHVCACSQRRP